MASIVISESESEEDTFQPFAVRTGKTADCRTVVAVTTSSGTSSVGRDDVITEVQADKGRSRKRKRPTEQQIDKMRMKQQQKEMKEKERATKKVAAKARKESQPAEQLKQMIVVLSTSLSENHNFMECLARELKGAGVQYRVCPGDEVAGGSVRWRRRQCDRSVDDTAQISEVVTEVEESELLVSLEAQGFAGLVYYTKKQQRGSSLPPGAQTLLQYVRQIQGIHTGVRLTLAVEGMESFLRAKKTRQNREFHRAVCSTNSSSSSSSSSSFSSSSSSSPLLSAILSEVSWVDCQEVVVVLGLETGCVVRMCPSSVELAEYVFTLTKALAEKPLSLQKGSPFSFHPDAALGSWKKTQDSADQLAMTWQHQLMQFNNMSEVMAAAIVSVYPSPSHLLAAYESSQSRSGAEQLLQDVMVRRGIGSVASTRRVGPVQSRRIYRFMTSRDPHMTVT